MTKPREIIGCSLLALLVIVALFACSRKSPYATNGPALSSDADSNWVYITADSTIHKLLLAEPERTSGSHVIIGPEGNLTDSVFIFGYAPQSAYISHVFWLHNGYDETLRIIRVSPG